MAKTKRKKTKKPSHLNSSKVLTYIIWALAFIALVLSALVAGYYFGYNDAKSEIADQATQTKQKRLALLKKLEKTTKENLSVKEQLKTVLKKEQKKSKTYIGASHELATPSALPPKPPKRVVKHTTKKPKLVIIIDDVGTKSQVNAIKNTGIPLTMSFLPPSGARPNTPKLAKNEPIYMVHLPMEAQNWSAEEPYTLRVNNTQQQISQRIAEIKKLFPRVHYINNHTGSKFTADEGAMNRLIYTLKKNHIYFIDSRTTAQTKAPLVMKNFGFKYVARDVFLDHHMDKSYVLQQIKTAIKTAKLHGSAIAIGHPHPNTLQALKESKDILKSVDVVYIDRLY